MEIDWLEDFLALANTGVFSRAAEKRNVSQPAFTRRIKKLEYWVGAPLFDRSVHPVALTDAGTEFQPFAFDIVRLLSQGRSAAHSQMGTDHETIRFTSLQSLAVAFFPTWLQGILTHIGPVRTKVVAEDLSNCVEAIMTGTADFMLCYSHPDVSTLELSTNFKTRIIAEDTLIAVCGTNKNGAPLHQLDDARVPFLKYSDKSFLGKVTNRLVERLQLTKQLDIIYENSMADALKSAALTGLGIAWLPSQLAQERLSEGKLVKLSQPEQETRISVALHRSNETASRQVERFWHFVEKTAYPETSSPTSDDRTEDK